MTKTIFLDLDGTLTDPHPGITKSVIYALEALGIKAPAAEDLTWVIGPPLIDSFARLGVPDPARALELYRERFSTVGLFENTVYPGIPDVLETLFPRYRLCLATAKPHVFAARIVSHFDIDPYLMAQFGPELDGTRNDKAELLAHALEVLEVEPGDCLMVGDRVNDFRAASAVGMQSLGVAWGYGSEDELALATRICTKPTGLVAAIDRMMG